MLRLPAIALCILPLGGCAVGGSSGEVEITTVAEAAQYRAAITPGSGPVEWKEPAAARQVWSEPPEGRQAAQAAIQGAALRLSGLDYSALSLPDFITSTRALYIGPTDFTGQGVDLDGYGAGGSQSERWALYRWQGPEFPQRTDRPLVHRWVHVYALYSLPERRVVRLLATIHGEAQE